MCIGAGASPVYSLHSRYPQMKDDTSHGTRKFLNFLGSELKVEWSAHPRERQKLVIAVFWAMCVCYQGSQGPSDTTYDSMSNIVAIRVK